MKNVKIKKKCPFCPINKSSYVFKTYHGLYRHVWRWHLLLKDKRAVLFPTDPEWIRVYRVKFSAFCDVKVNGKQHIDAILESYCKEELNPSLRRVGSKYLSEEEK